MFGGSPCSAFLQQQQKNSKKKRTRNPSINHPSSITAQMLPAPGSKGRYFREKVQQVFRTLAAFGYVLRMLRVLEVLYCGCCKCWQYAVCWYCNVLRALVAPKFSQYAPYAGSIEYTSTIYLCSGSMISCPSFCRKHSRMVPRFGVIHRADTFRRATGVLESTGSISGL